MRLWTGHRAIVLAWAGALGLAVGFSPATAVANADTRGNSSGLAHRLLNDTRSQWHSTVSCAFSPDRATQDVRRTTDPTYGTGGDVTQCPEETVCPEHPTMCVQTECPQSPTQCPEEATRCPVVPTVCPVITTSCPADPTLCGPCRPTEPGNAEVMTVTGQRSRAGRPHLPATTIPLLP